MKVESFPPIKKERIRLAKAKLALAGQTIEEWAEANNFSRAVAYKVLSGTSKALRGEGLKIAMALGLHDNPAHTLPPASPIKGLAPDAGGSKDNRDALLQPEVQP